MAVKIKLQRLGKIRTPHYRVIVADSRTRRSGRAIENLGIYEPKADPSVIRIDSERVQYALLKVTGDWQKFKGLPGAEGTLKAQPEKKSKLDLFNEALAEANNGPTLEAITEKRKAAKKAAEEAAAKEAEAEEAAEEKTEEESAE